MMDVEAKELALKMLRDQLELNTRMVRLIMRNASLTDENRVELETIFKSLNQAVRDYSELTSFMRGGGNVD